MNVAGDILAADPTSNKVGMPRFDRYLLVPAAPGRIRPGRHVQLHATTPCPGRMGSLQRIDYLGIIGIVCPGIGCGLALFEAGIDDQVLCQVVLWQGDFRVWRAVLWINTRCARRCGTGREVDEIGFLAAGWHGRLKKQRVAQHCEILCVPVVGNADCGGAELAARARYQGAAIDRH